MSTALTAGQAICRDGIRTGMTCGSLNGRLIATPYVTTGMPESIPGDSGAPLWQLTRAGTATMVGIWLGEHFTAAARQGRFIDLAAVIADLADTLT